MTGPSRSDRTGSRVLRAALVATVGVASAVVFACSVGILDETGKACTDACPGGLPCIDGHCGGAPADGGEASSDGVTPPVACAQPDGASRPGPEMAWIPVGDAGFCIDTTEVTNAQLNEYIIQSGALIDPPPACTDVDAAAPFVASDPSVAALPAAGMTFCYAWSYCRWAGKRLCGQLGTGGVVSSSADPHTLEWYYACANGRQDTIYPYGDTAIDGACNVESSGFAQVESFAGCRGVAAPYAQIFDMVGNAVEYVNNVDPGGNLAAVGGSYDSTFGAGTPSCTTAVGFNGTIFGFGQVGFRCCADP